MIQQYHLPIFSSPLQVRQFLSGNSQDGCRGEDTMCEVEEFHPHQGQKRLLVHLQSPVDLGQRLAHVECLVSHQGLVQEVLAEDVVLDCQADCQ